MKIEHSRFDDLEGKIVGRYQYHNFTYVSVELSKRMQTTAHVRNNNINDNVRECYKKGDVVDFLEQNITWGD